MRKFVKLIALCTVMVLVATTLLSVSAQALENSNSKTIVTTGAVGTGIGKQTTLVDFTTSNLYGFETLGNTVAPAFGFYETWQTNVLSTRIDSAQAQTGIHGTLANAALLKGTSTLSVRLLAQYANAADYTLTLCLEGTDKSGSPISLRSTASVPTTYWQTVTFDISAFAARANLDAPCKMTLLTSSNVESQEFVLWVHSIYASTLESIPDILMPAVIAGGSLVVGFTLFFVIYCTTCKKKRRPRW